MARDYDREERDWRRQPQQQQPSWRQDDRWSGNRTDDDFSMGLGQESRGSRFSRGGGPYQRREPEYAREYDDYNASESGWDQANEGFQQQPSRWQRSQNRIGGEYVPGSAYNRGQQGGENWNQPMRRNE